MQKKLKSSGNGWELYISKSILKLLGYDPTTVKLLITSENKTLYIRPLDESELPKYENNMVRRLQKSGGSYGLYLPAPLLEVLEITPENDFLEVTISNNQLFLKKSDIQPIQ